MEPVSRRTLTGIVVLEALAPVNFPSHNSNKNIADAGENCIGVKGRGLEWGR